LAAIPHGNSLKCYKLESIFEPGAGFWKDLWSSLVLNRQERRTFQELAGPERRHTDWLSGRTAAKDAICSFLRDHYGLNFLPADIEIAQDQFGRPVAHGSWTRHVPAIPELSIAHCDGLAVALVGDGVDGQRVGIDIEKIRELEPGFEGLVLNTQEHSLLDALPQAVRAEWLLRLWCVKEAISKALGRGLMEGPGSIRISSLDPRTGLVSAHPNGKLADAVPEAAGQTLQSYTVRDSAYVAAIALYGKKS
jgi:phosphopantetheinyl transferase